ncbi:GNAT family N-acetyltransferase [Bengtsoniella intestinalis]|uniref:GNAT family N-acetyltransferase n=1 Tax=Bengtsoniella intestinalis TaxID=3073143 RepID=UPI00391F8884
MKLIDAHMHIGQYSFCDVVNSNFSYDLCSTYEEIIGLMDANKVDKAIILPIPHKDFNIEKTNTYVLEAYQRYPDRLVPFCRIDDHLAENLRKGFRGVKLHLVYEEIDIKNIKKELQLIEDSNMPLILHAKFSNKVKQIEQIFKYAPNINLILAHMGRGHLYTGEQTIDNALALRKYPNLYMDLSTVGDLQSIINVCEIIGYDRVIYASDYPFGKNFLGQKYSYSDELNILSRYLRGERGECVFHKNIEGLLTLRDHVYIRRAKKIDVDSVMEIFNRISVEDQKFLAYNNKASLIRQIIRSERHCYVAVHENTIVGFLRESGRPEGFSLLEEVVVSPDYRGKGVATKLIKYYHRAFHKNMVKTNASNHGMISILCKNDYLAQNPDAPRIINWVRNGD